MTDSLSAPALGKRLVSLAAGPPTPRQPAPRPMPGGQLVLFPDAAAAAARPVGDGFCLAPIGRRRSARKRRLSRPSTAQLLAEIRGMLAGEVHAASARLGRIEPALTAQTAAIAALKETIDQLRLRVLAVERIAGTVAQPQPPKFTRRGEHA